MKGMEEFFHIFIPPLSFSKTEIPKYFLYALSQPLIRKLKRKRGLLTTISAVVVAVGIDVDAVLGSLGMVS